MQIKLMSINSTASKEKQLPNNSQNTLTLLRFALLADQPDDIFGALDDVLVEQPLLVTGTGANVLLGTVVAGF